MINPVFDNESGFYSAKVSVTAGNTSDFVKLPYNAETTVAVYPDTRARCEFTISPIADVEAGTATWLTWSLGTVTNDDADTLLGVASAVRLVSEQGAATMEVISK